MNIQMDSILSTMKDRKAHILGHQNFSKSAVMIPLIKREDDIDILFEVRSFELKHQPGEICFPGGRSDETDLNEEFTAKRELCEELGLQFEDIETIAPLDVLVTPFRGIIYPFVGEIKHPEKISPNPSEVHETFFVPLSYLKNTQPESYEMNIHLEPGKHFPFSQIPNRQRYEKRSFQTNEFFYYYDDYVIWGLTAKILHHFLDLLKKVEN